MSSVVRLAGKTIEVLCVALCAVACSGVPHTSSVKYEAHNASARQLNITLSIGSSDDDDSCKNYEAARKTSVVAPNSDGSDAVSVTCDYPETGSLEASVPLVDAGAAPAGFSYQEWLQLADPKAPVASVRVQFEDGTISQNLPITQGGLIDAHGLPEGTPLSQAFVASFAPYQAEQVRASQAEGAQAVFVYYNQTNKPVRAIGIPVAQVAASAMQSANIYNSDPRGVAIDGYWFGTAYENSFGGSFTFSASGSDIKVSCDGSGCQTK